MSQSDAFVQLLTGCQHRLYAYILTVTANEAVTAELLADTNAILWQKRSEFEMGTDFPAWALKVAHFRILAYQKRRKNDKHIFDAELLESVAETATHVAEELDERQTALEQCIQKLPQVDRQLVELRYNSNVSVQEIAKRRNKSPNAISHSLFRIRAALTECIERALYLRPSE